MDNFLKYVKISNYKSLKELQIQCKRINLFIGYPNVGKSNIIEALSLLDKSLVAGDRSLKSLCRHLQLHDLFIEQNTKKSIVVETDKTLSILKHFSGLDNAPFRLLNMSNQSSVEVENLKEMAYTDFLKYFQEYSGDDYPFEQARYFSNLLVTSLKNKSPWNLFTHTYKFKPDTDYTHVYNNSMLNTPHGENLFNVFAQCDEIKQDINTYLNRFGFDLVYNTVKSEFKIQKKVNGIVYETPFSLLADTLQRIVFYSAAIESNNNQVLLFEEPEVNSFPPFIQDLATRIIESKTNQFFITTHSPYLLNRIIESGLDDVVVNIVDFKDFQTTVKQLTTDELEELLSYDSDLFLNIDRYIK